MSDVEYGLSYSFRPSKSCGLPNQLYLRPIKILKPDTQRVRITTSVTNNKTIMLEC